MPFWLGLVGIDIGLMVSLTSLVTVGRNCFCFLDAFVAEIKSSQKFCERSVTSSPENDSDEVTV